jgi:predicted GIY-YIG superfamily endonuclease
MYYVYILRSVSEPSQIYIGVTSDLMQRLTDHNAGKSLHTAKYLPWEIACHIGMPDKQQAFEFEKYLKSHSGRAFAAKRLVKRPAKGDPAETGKPRAATSP